MTKKRFSLRERKSAKTKIALMNEFVKRLEHTNLDNISIREVCEAVDVSEGTFYNYFPAKPDVIYFHIAAFSAVSFWRLFHEIKPKSELEKIDGLLTAMAIEKLNPNQLYGLMSAIIGQRQCALENENLKITAAEKYYAFPECEGIADVEPSTLLFKKFFKECLKKAIENKELPVDTNVEETVVHLKTILSGVALAVETKDFSKISEYRNKHLGLLWKALDRKY